MNIGVFDSGLGGLTILKEFIEVNPRYNYLYLGDNARVPYGNHSAEVIYRFTCQALEFLIHKKCSLIIIACNTATSAALKKMQTEFVPQKYPHVKLLGIIRPVVEEAIKKKFSKVGVIGTNATINAHAFYKEFKKNSAKIKIIEKSCPLLVPIIEAEECHWIGTDLILQKYLSVLKRAKIKALILGCTHYNILSKQISNILGPNVKILSEGKIAAIKLKEYLSRHAEIDNQLEKLKHEVLNS